ncbi:MAG: hypothetical protein CVV33_09320 [Methanomicrobiales archaeon HGW-Methanomicrobiales-4]|nr:MAG: hypothetical protein CVV33_09320 [Methanomicrobiales archaeon HGW-Methanomicrobiales-4]
MSADSGYHLMDLRVDNASIGAFSAYTFSNVRLDHRIEAVFTMVILPPVVSGVTPTSGQQNTLVNLVISGQNFSGNEQIDLVRNGTANLTRIGTLSGNNLVVSGLNLTNAPVGSWDLWVTNLTTRMSGVKKDAFTVTGGQKPFYTITTKSDKYGWITPSGQIKVKAGSRKQFTMHTVRGAEIENVTVDGIPVTLDHHKEYTFMSVTADHMLCLNTKPYGDQVITNFTVNQTSGPAPFMVRFTDTSSGSPARWLWNFGDGKISTLQNPVHTYKKQGWYSVRLTAGNGKSVDTKMVNKLIRVTGGRGSLSESEEEEAGISTPVPVISSTGTPLVVKTGRQVISGSDILSVSPELPGQREVLTTG